MVSVAGLLTAAAEGTIRRDCGLWRVVGASALGTSHARRGQPCQDWQSYRCLPGGGLVVAVADGAGSAGLAERGSQRAVEAALDAAALAAQALLANKPQVEPTDWNDLMRWVFSQARKAVAARAHSEHHLLRQYATTLSVAVAAGGWLAVAQIGDGAVVVEDASGALIAATRLQKGEYANETHFLTDRGAVKRLETWVDTRPVKALAAMSDGLVRLALRLPSGEPHRPFFAPLFHFIANVTDEPQARQQLADFLSSERVCARTDDDKSLVLAACLSSPDSVDVQGKVGSGKEAA